MRQGQTPKPSEWIILVAIISLSVIGLWTCLAPAANEISINAFLKVANGDFTLQRNVQNLQRDQIGRSMTYGIQNITTATNPLTIGTDVGIGGYSFFRNIGTQSTVFVQVDFMLKPGDLAIVRVASTNILTFTTNGTTDFEYWVNEE